MNFSCDRCGKRFTTSDEPIPGRTYRIPCGCGNDVVLEVPAGGLEERPRTSAPRSAPTPRPRILGAPPPRRDGDPFAPPGASEPLPEDPFAPASPPEEPSLPPALDVTPTLLGSLARRDPDAPTDESAEYHMPAASSFDEVLRRARRQGFLVGAVAGAIAAVGIAVGLAIATSRPSAPPAAVPDTPPSAASTAVPGTLAAEAASPPPSDSPAVPLAPHAGTPAPRQTPPASPPVMPVPGIGPGIGPDTRPARARTGVPKAQAEAEAAVPAGVPGTVGEPVPGTEAGTEAADAVPGIDEAVPGSGVEPDGGRVRGYPDPDQSASGARVSGAGDADVPVSGTGDAGDAVSGTGDSAVSGTGEEGDVPAAEPADPSDPPREADVKGALAARQDVLDECIDAAEGEPAAARGQRFRLVVVVEPSGAVGEARVDDPEIAPTPLGACLVELARTLRFPPFGGEPARVEVRVRHGVSE